jgi:hypothetical protein
MTALISIPVIPAMPNRPQYSIYDIAIVHHFQTRDQITAAFHEQPPPFDITKRPKFWIDTSVNPDDHVSYDVPGLDTFGQPTYKKITMPGAEANAFNVMGDYVYLAYAVQPTGAIIQLNATGMPVNSHELATEDQAKEIVEMLRSKLPTMTLAYREPELAPPDRYVYPADEPRRAWEIFDANTGQYVGDVGEFVFFMNNKGVGAPGHWATGNNGLPLWTPEYPPNHPTNPALTEEWPTPVRSLNSVEKLVLSFGSTITIQRTDLMPITTTPGAVGAGYTDADRTRDNESHAWLMSLSKKLAL